MTDEIWRWPGSDDIGARGGQCYTLAMEAILSNAHLGDRLFLVHGVLHADRSSLRDGIFTDIGALPPANPHAWCEVEADDGVMCLDPVLRFGEEHSEFYAIFGAEVTRRYRADIAVTIAMRRDNYGPWDKASLTMWAERQAHAAEHPEWSTEQALARHFARVANSVS